ncbi:MAG TPA: class I SAM-dependent methyltransferase [Anaerolineales bacterium]|nr:class I SAM-dependent methyltransferase [Anaerolineales bacterium]HNN12699.1 class I SAM-dependent methyltransferase [Anaerolineales bacterium]HNO31662.1 class I SAM-dependent methyltransferase [Anaerolineales bacterium]
MRTRSAKYYDEIYAANGKDYPAEAALTHKIIRRYKKSKNITLLDVGCGTGIHLGLLKEYYQAEGLDIDPFMLKEARKNYPDLHFHQGDMANFDLGRSFDVVISLFSAIGYARTKARLNKTLQTMARHLNPQGVVLIEPWFTPEQWNPGRVFTTLSSKTDSKVFRMSYSGRKGKISIIEFHYLIGTPKGIEYTSEILKLGLFTQEEYIEAFQKADLTVTYDPKGLDGRGLYIGVKS